MKHLSLALSATALLVALLGTTAVGPAAAELAANVVPFAKVAGKASVADNAKRLNGRRSTVKALPNTIPVVGPDGKLPASLGAVGPQGPKGDKGQKGERGPSGISGYEVVGIQVPSNPAIGASWAGAAKCPAGKKLLGGGAYVSPPGYPAAITESWPRRPETGDEWYAKAARYADGGTVRWSIYVFAICANVQT